jgi:2,4-dienoyl-CoA reductase-like NADH-dependent reductase (Old Yellow Enzyme family)
MEKLFTAYPLGDVELSNLVVMAPMTRSRATKGYSVYYSGLCSRSKKCYACL